MSNESKPTNLVEKLTLGVAILGFFWTIARTYMIEIDLATVQRELAKAELVEVSQPILQFSSSLEPVGHTANIVTYLVRGKIENIGRVPVHLGNLDLKVEKGQIDGKLADLLKMSKSGNEPFAEDHSSIYEVNASNWIEQIDRTYVSSELFGTKVLLPSQTRNFTFEFTVHHGIQPELLRFNLTVSPKPSKRKSHPLSQTLKAALGAARGIYPEPYEPPPAKTLDWMMI